MRMVGTFCTKALTLVSLASLGRSPRTTSSAFLRWPKGLSVMVMRPMFIAGLKLLVPMKDISASTLGSWLMMSATCCCSTAMPSKEMSCGPSTKQNSWPESSLGRKPLGARWNSTPVPTTMAKNAISVSRWWASTTRSEAA